MLVSICAITYQRPDGLRRLLNGLNCLTFKALEPPNIEVIVVDNDSTGSALAIINEIKPSFQWSLIYGIEPRQGISYARNRAIALASEKADFIVTIDDDEVPEPNWLEQLLLVQQQYKADIVSGPVLPYFDGDRLPNWVQNGRFFEMSRFPTGHRRHMAFCGNVLVKHEIFKKQEKIFDERFSLTGGEDTDLFMRLYKKGYKIIWADEAIAHEWVASTRITPKWILMRGFRCWSNYSLVERELYPSLKIQTIRFAKGSALIALGLFSLVPGLIRGKAASVKALLSIYRGLGTLAGLFGIYYEEYKKIEPQRGLGWRSLAAKASLFLFPIKFN
jgi:GT2 family glycosyltransferase